MESRSAYQTPDLGVVYSFCTFKTTLSENEQTIEIEVDVKGMRGKDRE